MSSSPSRSAAILAVVISAVAGGLRVALTGRIASRAMFELRVRVFTHLQRLSLDYFTSEKAGVIMTHMMSDIESLQQLLQDGLVQFGVQGLTMVIVAIVLLTMNVQLALITLFVLVPVLLVLSLWFRSASETVYGRIRDGIAAVLTDVSESLQGVRVVAGFNRQRHNVLNHRNIVGEYRDRNDESAAIVSTFGASTEFVGIIGQAMLLLIGGTMVQNGTLSDRAADGVRALPQLVLPADPAAGAAVQPLPAGTDRDRQAQPAAVHTTNGRGSR